MRQCKPFSTSKPNRVCGFSRSTFLEGFCRTGIITSGRRYYGRCWEGQVFFTVMKSPRRDVVKNVPAIWSWKKSCEFCPMGCSIDGGQHVVMLMVTGTHREVVSRRLGGIPHEDVAIFPYVGSYYLPQICRPGHAPEGGEGGSESRSASPTDDSRVPERPRRFYPKTGAGGTLQSHERG